jgi:hypothetical protein
VKVDQVRVIRDRPPPGRSEIVPCLLIATFLVNPFPNLIAVRVWREFSLFKGITTVMLHLPCLLVLL